MLSQKVWSAGRYSRTTSIGLIFQIGWAAVKWLRKAKIHIQSDERILGDSDFIDDGLKAADASLQHRYALMAQGCNLDRLAEKMGMILGLDPEQIFTPGKQPVKVRARCAFCCWATREPGVAATKMAEMPKISRPAVNICASRGEQIVLLEGYDLMDEKKIIY